MLFVELTVSAHHKYNENIREQLNTKDGRLADKNLRNYSKTELKVIQLQVPGRSIKQSVLGLRSASRRASGDGGSPR